MKIVYTTFQGGDLDGTMLLNIICLDSTNHRKKRKNSGDALVLKKIFQTPRRIKDLPVIVG